MTKNRRHRLSEPSQPMHSGSRILPFISGLGLGAGLMYVLDPERGEHRRQMAQQRLFRLFGLAGDAMDKGIRDVAGAVKGTFTREPRPGPSQSRASTTEVSGEGRRDIVGQSGVYPATGPFPPGPAEVRVAGSFGGGSYEEHGYSEMTYTGDTVLGALSGEEEGPRTSLDLLELMQPGEIPRERWLSFFNTLDKGLNGEPVTVEVRQGGHSYVVQRDVPIDGLGADVKARELIIDIGVGQTKDDLVIHSISAKNVTVRDGGDSRLLEVEANDGRVVIVSFRKADLAPKRVVA